MSAPRRIIVAISGASGAVYGARLLQVMQSMAGIESHLVVSDAGWRNLAHELDMDRASVEALAHRVHDVRNVGAAIASGSFQCAGMVIAPCSMRTLVAIAHGYGESLVHRSADVILKERRKLVLVPRETPLSEIHLENMLKLARMGVTMLPPMPAFYNHPKTIDDIVDHIVARVLDQFGIPADFAKRWDGHLSHPEPVKRVK